jgi:ADP-ribose pyrophosphatase
MTEGRMDVKARRIVHAGRIFKVSVDRVALANGREVDMEVVRHGSSVVLVPLPDPEHVVLIRQYRYAIDQWIWELPAGGIEPGETPEAAARRECHEEIGRLPEKLTLLASLYPTPGFCDERMHLYRLDGLVVPAAEAEADPDEQIEPRTFTLREARNLVARGEIVDMKTVVGLQLV